MLFANIKAILSSFFADCPFSLPYLIIYSGYSVYSGYSGYRFYSPAEMLFFLKRPLSFCNSLTIGGEAAFKAAMRLPRCGLSLLIVLSFIRKEAFIPQSYTFPHRYSNDNRQKAGLWLT